MRGGLQGALEHFLVGRGRWLYSRQRGLVSVSLSHLVLGFWAFYVVGVRLD